MKILVDFQDIIGGAPRSLLEHATLLKNNHEIVAVIPIECDVGFFANNNFKIYFIPRFYLKNIFKNLFILYRYYKLVKEEKIQLIYTNRVIHCQFLSIVSDFTKVPILNARAGGVLTTNMVKVHKDKHYIVYSEENIEAFKKAGFASEHLFLMRNRISFPKTKSTPNASPEKKLVITITGSIKRDTLNGILWFLNFLEKRAQKAKYSCSVNIAGENILKTEEEKKLFQETIIDIKKSIPKNWEIEHLGWVDNISQLHAKSHICIGKGRSVIQPGMMGKITFVISESGSLYRCKEDIYSSLLYFNFSGRGNIQEVTNSNNEFIQLLSNQTAFKRFQEEAENLVFRFKKDYDVQYAQDKLEKIVHKVENNQIRHNNPFKSGFIKFFRIYFEYFKSKL